MDKVRGLRATGLVEMEAYNLDGVSQHKCNLHRSKCPMRCSASACQDAGTLPSSAAYAVVQLCSEVGSAEVPRRRRRSNWRPLRDFETWWRLLTTFCLMLGESAPLEQKFTYRRSAVKAGDEAALTVIVHP